MGTKLKDIVNIKTIKLRELGLKTLAVDGCNLLFKYTSKIKTKQNYVIQDRLGRPKSHLQGFFYFIINLFERKIKPVFVFDGIPLDTKRNYGKKELKRINFLFKQYKRSDENKSKLFRNKFFLYKFIIEDLMDFIRLFGIPVIRGPSEGEAQATRLVKEKLAYGVISSDYDCLLYGCPRIYKNWSFKRDIIEFISLNDTLDTHKITNEQLIDISILMGNDYFPGYKGFGPVKSLKEIKKFGNIFEIKKEYNLNDDLNSIRNIFLNPYTVSFNPKYQAPNPAVISEYLVNRDFSPKRIKKGISRLMNAYKNIMIKQTTINQYFQ
ncbi:MAG: hypothetical protein GF329_16195 [Candidatus Lokiarchaeota archaeon]|nr:hypothetical protein [Candidatus Lokiarchaeota archaeon]